MERFLLGLHKERQQAEQAERRRAMNNFSNDAVEAQLYRDINSLDNSRRMASELMDMGHSILQKLREQNITLKRARKRLLDMANTIGLSRAVMRFIERRQMQDQIIVFGGMILIVILFVVLVYYFRW